MSFFPGFEQRRVTVDDIAFNVRIGGSGSPLLLLHGYPQTHVTWHKVAPELARHFTVVCPDLKGYGDSDAPAPTAERSSVPALPGSPTASSSCVSSSQICPTSATP